MISVSIIKEPVAVVEEPVQHRGGALVLTDRQRGFVEHFIDTMVPRRSRPAFGVAMSEKLAGGRPGEAALRRAVALAALDIGVQRETLQRIGLLMRNETTERHRGAKVVESDDDD